MFTISLPEDVRTIITALEAHGHEAYAVGGCVRDSLLGREPKDWDITTDAAPEEVKAVFRRCIDTGIAHGTVTVMMHGTGYEVTTFRVDGNYSDGRHPDSVRFTGQLSEDLKRRDFTINAMAYSESRGLVDLFGGQRDLETQVIRAVGEPAERFREDALRIMRLVRFSAQLGFQIEAQTFAAAKELSGRLSKISAERIREEFMKTLLSGHPEKLLLFEECGALEIFFPEFSAALNEEEKAADSKGSVSGGKENIEAAAQITALSGFPADPVLRLAALFDGIRTSRSLSAAEAEAIADRRLRALKFDNRTRENVCFLMRWSEAPMVGDARYFRHLLAQTGKERFPMLLEFKRLEAGAASGAEPPEFARAESTFEGILMRNECTSIAELAVSGKDLAAAGTAPGKAMGETLRMLLDRVLDDPSLNEREKLLTIARNCTLQKRTCKEQ